MLRNDRDPLSHLYTCTVDLERSTFTIVHVRRKKMQKWQHFVLKSKPYRYLSSVYTFYHAHGKSLHFDRETPANIKLVHCAWFSDEFGTTCQQRQILDARASATMAEHQMHPSATHETGQVAGGKRPLPQRGKNSVGPTEKLCWRMHVPRVAGNVGKSIRNATSPMQTYTIDNMTCSTGC